MDLLGVHKVESFKNDNVFSNFFDSNIFLLKLSGFWIYDVNTPSRIKYSQLIYNVFWTIYLHFCYLPTELLYPFFHIDDGLNTVLRALRDGGNHWALLYKAINYYKTREDLLKLMKILQSNRFKYENSETFNPKLIVQIEKKQAFRWTLYFWCFCNTICLTMFLSGLYVFIFEQDKQFLEVDGEQIYVQKLPVYTVSPFGYGTRKAYLLTFFTTIVALTFYAWMIVGKINLLSTKKIITVNLFEALDSLFISLMSCITAHVKILQGAFRTLRPRCLKRLGYLRADFLHDPPDLSYEMEEEIKVCSKHLQMIFSASETLESIYHGQTLFQTIASLGEMCFSLYLMSEVPT